MCVWERGKGAGNIMTTSVRLCLSYNHFRLDIIAFKVDNCSTEIVQQKMYSCHGRRQMYSCHGRRHDVISSHQSVT